ncbi:ferritin-like domain-containing protein [Amnibacterium kyonggiense]|uniref:Ferritin-like protein n=1 Tax=Amnibacterium kyonggiense TaxID=595671 RepID=A0A4R7FRK7_9MICO|nr:ferritin-like domain-containing protein [Amnibacterium kyonggiense]TDS80462.1 ferritin-like protein [Amnibacterium kyonggiense]
MFGKQFLGQVVERSAETAVDRRKLLTMAGIAGAGAGAAVLGSSAAATAAPAHWGNGPVNDGSILNFALNLEYLEAEFYLRAVTGEGLPDGYTTGKCDRGRVRGGHKVPFRTKAIKNYAREIAMDEKDHVAFLRSALGNAKVSRPSIDLQTSFTAAATAAGVIKKGQTFDPFASETNFLLGAFLFEDVGVTAYKGAAPLITNKTYLDAAAGILAVEAYHAGIVRTTLYAEGFLDPSLYGTVNKLSDARDLLDGPGDDDQGIGDRDRANLVPTDRNSIAYSRTPGAVLDIVYLNLSGKPVDKGGFYPHGVNGAIHVSA